MFDKTKIKSNKPKYEFPQFAVFMGSPKVGKSRAMAKLKDALICDLENGRGYNSIEVEAKVDITDKNSLRETLDFFFSPKNTAYKILVIDHLRMLTSFFGEYISKKGEVEFVEDIGWQKGVRELEDTVRRFLKYVNQKLGENPNKRVFLVAHANTKANEVRLDVDGKNENLILGAVDCIGYISRDMDGGANINFKMKSGSEFGSRNPYLANYSGVLDWDLLFKVAKGEDAK